MVSQQSPGFEIQAHRAKRGFTLIEMMVAMVVGGIVISGIFAFSSIQKGLGAEHRREARSSDTLEGGMWAIGRDLQMAGLGLTRTCTEVRIWDGAGQRLINPGAVQVAGALVGNVARDELTEEPFWVLRDGVQAHWRSAGADTFVDDTNRSASANAAGDSLDVILGEGNFAAASGAFAIDAANWGADLPVRQLTTGPTANLVAVSTQALSEQAIDGSPAAILSSDDEDDLAAVRQLLPPGSFILVAGVPAEATDHRPERQSQCALLQITGDVMPGLTAGQWNIPVSSESGFNANLEDLLGLGAAGGATPMYQRRTAIAGGTGDWDDPFAAGATLVPLGYLRWSRYEVDYSVQSSPYLVRTDIIGWVDGDETIAAKTNYPSCQAGTCPMPQLRLPSIDGLGSESPRIAVAPMIEDMQVAVGCDGYTSAAVLALPVDDPRRIPVPDLGFEEQGANRGGPLLPNVTVDEWDLVNMRDRDEWHGNARAETWGPDCVFYGTGQAYRAAWSSSGFDSESGAAPGFRMSPQVVRVSMLVRSQSRAFGAGSMTDVDAIMTMPIEDRPQINAVLGQRGFQVQTERFTPPNLRFRDPTIR